MASSDRRFSTRRLVRVGAIAIGALGLLFLCLYLWADPFSCAGPLSWAWHDVWLDRRAEAARDYDRLTEETTVEEWAELADRATARYEAQKAENPPKCLEDFQELVLEFFFLEAQFYQGAVAGNWDEAVRHDEASIEVDERIGLELQRLGRDYWDEMDRRMREP